MVNQTQSSMPEDSDLEDILHYAIDSQENEALHGTNKRINLTPETFYGTDGIYLSTPAFEGRVAAALRASSAAIAIIGPAGCGKTTRVTAALRKYRQDEGIPFARIDFKQLQADEQVPQTTLGRPSRAAVEAWVVTRMKSVLDRLARSAITAPELRLSLLLKDKAWERLAADEALQAIRSEVELTCSWETRKTGHPDATYTWFLERIEARDERVLPLLKALGATLSLRAAAYLAAESCVPKKSIQVPLFIDNIDSLWQNEVRELVYRVVRKLQPGLSNFVRILIATRPENYPFGDFEPDAEAYPVEEIKLGHEYGAAWPAPDEHVLTSSPIEDAEKVQHSDVVTGILRKRLDFAERKLKEGTLRPVNGARISWLRTIEANSHVDDVLKWFSNGNQRLRSVLASKFSEELVRIAPPGIVALGSDRKAQQVALVSLLYYWLGRKMSARGEGHYNWSAALDRWRADPGCTLGCLMPHVVLSALRNASGARRGKYVFGRGLTFGQLAAILKTIQIDEDTTARTIMELATRGGLGRLIDLNLAGEDVEALPDELEGGVLADRAKPGTDSNLMAAIRRCDSIRVNLRGCAILEHLSTRFFYFIGCAFPPRMLRGEEQGPAAILEVTADQHREIFDMMSALAQMTLSGLRTVRERMQRPDWFEAYRSRFCVSVKGAGMFRDDYGNLLIDNMMDVFLRFWSAPGPERSWPHGGAFTPGMRSAYEDLLRRFRESVDELAKGKDPADIQEPVRGGSRG